MDAAMAPPLKRRKLSPSIVHDISNRDNSTVAPEAFPHSVEQLPQSHPPLAPSCTPYPYKQKQQPRIQHAPVGGIEDFKVLVPRQGTGSSSNSSPPVTSSTANSSAHVSSATHSGVSVTGTSETAATSPASVTSSATSSASSSSARSTSRTSSSITLLSGNATSSTSLPHTTSSATSSERTSSLNLTTSAIILIGESTTTTSKTTITLTGSGTSSTASREPSTAFVFVVTLSDGETRTFSQSSGAYTTTLRNGETFTIPSSSASKATSHSTSTTRSAFRTSDTSSEKATSSSDRSTVTSILTLGTAGGAGPGPGTPAYTTPITSSTGLATTEDRSHNDNTPPAGTIAGGVVGGCAGLAVVLLIVMLFIRWYRRRTRTLHQALPPGYVNSPGEDGATERSAPGMAERAGLAPLVAAIPGLMRHQNRSADPSEPSERGFTRVSGRKLPSAFSEGMTSEAMSRERPPPGMPLRGSPPDAEGSLSGHSFYRDSNAFYGSDGVRGQGGLSISPDSPTTLSNDAPTRNNGTAEMMTMSPGPQRQPQVHAGGPYTMAPSSPAATSVPLARSDTPSSLRNSRFTEDM